MNDQTREDMKEACSTLRLVRENLQSASASVTDTAVKNRISNQLKALHACLEECEHISANVSQI